ncbi:MAG TPA: DNA polymerase domain-containing protein [Ktedonobacteraceae bacterium]|nr:DNA polymerase domain-containing protein [Ktedonobacteraceae bacterium]
MLPNIFTNTHMQHADARLFGWDPTPGIVSVWANRDGRAVVWRRDDEQVTYTVEQFRPWLFARSLDDLKHLGTSLQTAPANREDTSSISYRELDGSEGSYRYFLSARDGRLLERALTTGASRRLNRSITSLHDLQDDYYRVGPVEQYLMLTGRVYFRGMVYDDLHRLQFDLETTALDPHRGRIFLVAVRDNRGFATTLEAATQEDEAQLIADLCALIRERDPDVIENHNLFGFDLSFLEQRSALLKVPLALGRKGGPALLERREETLAIGPEARKRTRYSVAGRELIDTLDAVRRHDFVVRDMPSYRLKEVARYFGMATPERVYIEGAAIYDTFRSDPELVRRYAFDDVTEVDGLSRRLLGSPFALASMAPRRYERLASAGPAMGILEPMLVRAYLREGAALPYAASSQNSGEGLHEGGAVHLFAEGVAEHVVKADVASLYPSLMRTYQIGPSCDRLGVLLSILDRLTDLRLAHKAAARTAIPGSVEANMHDATQAAMKILINSAYGYMGAGSMALFADSHAAGEVTRRGREVLTKVLNSIRERGMALIEADTDGVYFAVPSDWTEEQERTLVAEVGAELPEGIRLEYEGRYRAMFSHEVKNYALLTYNGRLIVHGVALRSSRSEPFGERFLRQALLCTMTDDIVGVRNVYFEMVNALRNRSLPASELGARVRLSKTPEAYLANRAGHSEPQYEALLAAGRTRWYPGERVRFYRTRGKKFIWLPEEAEEATVGRDEDEDVDTDIVESEHDLLAIEGHQAKGKASRRETIGDRRDYDVEHYLHVLVTSYASRLRKAFTPTDFEQLFRLDAQPGLFDRPVESIQPRWIRCG